MTATSAFRPRDTKKWSDNCLYWPDGRCGYGRTGRVRHWLYALLKPKGNRFGSTWMAKNGNCCGTSVHHGKHTKRCFHTSGQAPGAPRSCSMLHVVLHVAPDRTPTKRARRGQTKRTNTTANVLRPRSSLARVGFHIVPEGKRTTGTQRPNEATRPATRNTPSRLA